MTKIFVALLRLNRGPHAIDASLLDVYTGVHRVDNPRGQTCELVCKAAPKLRACIRLEVLFRLKRRHDHFIRATCAGNAQKQQLEQARFLTRCLVVLLKYGALLSDPGQHGMLAAFSGLWHFTRMGLRGRRLRDSLKCDAPKLLLAAQ